jgi:sulfur-oxidizing protein SoxZ
MANPMRIRAQVQGDKVTVRVLVSHDMESGLRKTPDGKLVPAHFIQTINATCNGKTVMSAQLGTAVSKNPFVQFSFTGAKAGDKIVVNWEDNRGDKRKDEAAIA